MSKFFLFLSLSVVLAGLPSRAFGKCTVTDEDIMQYIQIDNPELPENLTRELISMFKDPKFFREGIEAGISPESMAQDPYSVVRKLYEVKDGDYYGLLDSLNVRLSDRTVLLLFAYRFGLGCVDGAENEEPKDAFFYFYKPDPDQAPISVNISGQNIIFFSPFYLPCKDTGLGNCQVLNTPLPSPAPTVLSKLRKQNEEKEKKPIHWEGSSTPMRWFQRFLEGVYDLF